MNSKKTIFKSLLMIVALSFAVSCSKDEDGGTKTPTNPTTTTIKASDITAAFQALKPTTTGADIDFSGFSASGGKASLDATISSAITIANLESGLKTAIEGMSISGATITAAASSSSTATDSDSNPYIMDVTIKADNLDTTMTEYTYSATDKTAKVEITITPDKKWDSKEK